MIRQYKDKHKGETCIIVGNGPSLKGVPTGLLEKYPTFGANKVFMLPGFTPTYYTIIDQYMIHDCAPVLAEGKFKPDAMFIRRGFPIPGSEQIETRVKPGFSTDVDEYVIMGGTVTFANLQIAFYMGFTTVLLVGVDHNYPSIHTRPGFVFQAEGADQNHFDPDYFKSGHLYAAPELEGTTHSYAEARRVYEDAGRKIINLTEGSQLDVYDKGEYKEWLTTN